MAQPDTSPQITADDAMPPQAVPPQRRALGGLLVLVGVSLFGLLLFQIAGPRPIPPPKVVHYTPQQAADARKDLNALSDQLTAPSPAVVPPAQQSSAAQATGKPEAINPPIPASAKANLPVRLQLSQADLNTYLATDTKVKAMLASRGIQAVQLLLQPPHAVTCRAAVFYKGHKTNIQITGDLMPDRDALVRFVATKAQVGALPLPTKVVTAQSDRIAGQFFGRVRGRIPVIVQNIQVVGDHLVLIGIRRPSRPK